MATSVPLTLVLQLKDDATGALKGIGDKLGALGKVAAGLATGAAAGVGAVAAGVAKLTMDAAEIPDITRRFENLSTSIGETADVMLSEMSKAVQGTVTDVDLMSQASKLMSMGLADSSEQASKLAKIAYELGDPTQEVTANMENLALMLANQSLPRLDSFGISSGKVRTRINELMEATEDMTREEAFMIAVMEEADVAMEKVGERTVDAKVRMDQMKVTFENVKDRIGVAFIPILGSLVEALAPVITDVAEGLIPVAERAAEWLGENLPVAIGKLADFWTNTLRPAMERVSEFMEDPLLPIIERLWEWLEDTVPRALDKLANFWDNTLRPALNRAWSFIQANVIPILSDLADWLSVHIPPALEAVSSIIRDSVVPFLGRLADGIGTVSGKISDFLGRAGDFINRIRDIGGSISNFLGNLLPGSEPPLAQGIRQIIARFGEWGQVMRDVVVQDMRELHTVISDLVVQDMRELWQTLGESDTEGLLHRLGRMTESMDGLANTIGARSQYGLASVIEELSMGMADLATTFEEAQVSGASLDSTIAALALSAGDTLQDKLRELVGWLRNAIDLGGLTIDVDVGNIKERIQWLLTNVKDILGEITEWFAAEAQTDFEAQFTAFTENVAPLVDLFTKAMTPIAALTGVIAKALDDLRKLNPSRVHEAFNFYLKQTLANIKDDCANLGPQYLEPAVAALELALPLAEQVRDKLILLFEAIVHGVEGLEGLEEGVYSSLVHGLRRAIEDAKVELGNFVSWLDGDYRGQLAGISYYSEGYAAGKSYCDGMRDGLGTCGGGPGGGIPKGAALPGSGKPQIPPDIHSPSTTWKYIGEMRGLGMMLGWAEGIEKGLPQFDAALQKFADRLIGHSPITTGPLKGWSNQGYINFPTVPIDPEGLQRIWESSPHAQILRAGGTLETANQPAVSVPITIRLEGPVTVRRRKDIDDLAGAIDERLRHPGNVQMITRAVEKGMAKNQKLQTRYGVRS